MIDQHHDQHHGHWRDHDRPRNVRQLPAAMAAVFLNQEDELLAGADEVRSARNAALFLDQEEGRPPSSPKTKQQKPRDQKAHHQKAHDQKSWPGGGD